MDAIARRWKGATSDIASVYSTLAITSLYLPKALPAVPTAVLNAGRGRSSTWALEQLEAANEVEGNEEEGWTLSSRGCSFSRRVILELPGIGSETGQRVIEYAAARFEDALASIMTEQKRGVHPDELWVLTTGLFLRLTNGSRDSVRHAFANELMSVEWLSCLDTFGAESGLEWVLNTSGDSGLLAEEEKAEIALVLNSLRLLGRLPRMTTAPYFAGSFPSLSLALEDLPVESEDADELSAAREAVLLQCGVGDLSLWSSSSSSSSPPRSPSSSRNRRNRRDIGNDSALTLSPDGSTALGSKQSVALVVPGKGERVKWAVTELPWEVTEWREWVGGKAVLGIGCDASQVLALSTVSGSVAELSGGHSPSRFTGWPFTARLTDGSFVLVRWMRRDSTLVGRLELFSSSSDPSTPSQVLDHVAELPLGSSGMIEGSGSCLLFSESPTGRSVDIPAPIETVTGKLPELDEVGEGDVFLALNWDVPVRAMGQDHVWIGRYLVERNTAVVEKMEALAMFRQWSKATQGKSLAERTAAAARNKSILAFQVLLQDSGWADAVKDMCWAHGKYRFYHLLAVEGAAKVFPCLEAVVGREWVSQGVQVSNWRGMTPLHMAAWAGHVKTCLALVKAGADVNARNLGDETPLDLACQEGHGEIVKILVHAGADVNSTTVYGWKPLAQALDSGYEAVAKWLVAEAGASVESVTLSGASALEFAAICEPATGAVSWLSSLMDADKAREIVQRCKPFHFAACGMWEELSRALSFQEIGVNDCTPSGDSLLMWAIAGRTGRFGLATMSQLLAAGADPGLVDRTGRTALHWAMDGAPQVGVMNRLLSLSNVDVNARDSSGRTPLWIAAKTFKQVHVRLLLEAGADPLIADDEGVAPLSLTAPLSWMTLAMRTPSDLPKEMYVVTCDAPFWQLEQPELLNPRKGELIEIVSYIDHERAIGMTASGKRGQVLLESMVPMQGAGQGPE